MAKYLLKNYLFTLFVTLFTAVQFYFIWIYDFSLSYVRLADGLFALIITTVLDVIIRKLRGFKAILFSFILGPIRLIPQLITLYLVFFKKHYSQRGNDDIEGFGETFFYVLMTYDHEFPYRKSELSSNSGGRSSSSGRRVGNRDSSRKETPRGEISSAMDRIARNYSKSSTISTCGTVLDIRTSVDVKGVSTGYIVFTISGNISGVRRIPDPYDASDARSSIQDYLQSLSSSIMYAAESAFSNFVTSIDYSVNVRIGHIDINS